MQTKDYLQYIVEKIHSTVFATVDNEGRPVTCAIDMMDYDENGLYFLTARGKNFYDRLKANVYRHERRRYPFLRSGIGAGQSKGDRTGQIIRPVSQKSIHGENLSRCTLPQRPNRFQNLRRDRRMV